MTRKTVETEPLVRCSAADVCVVVNCAHKDVHRHRCTCDGPCMRQAAVAMNIEGAVCVEVKQKR